MSNFGEISLSYKERFVILFALNNLPAHDMRTAQMFRDLREPLRFDEVTKFATELKDPLPDPVIDFEMAPQFLIVVPNIVRKFFNRFGFPPPIAQEALDFLDRMDSMIPTEDNVKPAPSVVPVDPLGGVDTPGPEEGDELGGVESGTVQEQVPEGHLLS